MLLKTVSQLTMLQECFSVLMARQHHFPVQTLLLVDEVKEFRCHPWDNEMFSSVKSKTLRGAISSTDAGNLSCHSNRIIHTGRGEVSAYDGLLPFPDPQDLPMC